MKKVLLVLLIMVLFSSIQVRGEKNDNSYRNYYRAKGILYRFIAKDSYTTQYWPRASSSMDIQSMDEN